MARHRWFLHKANIKPLDARALAGIYQHLSTHHSKDVRFLSAIRRSIAIAMAHQDQLFPWRCQCGSLNAKRAVHCPICAQHWTSGTPHATQPRAQGSGQNRQQRWHQQAPRQAQSWKQEMEAREQGQWVKSPRRQSPRHRSSSNRAKPNKGKGKGKQKGGLVPQVSQDNSEVKQQSGPPAVLPTYQEAPWLMAPPPPIPPITQQADPNATAATAAVNAAEAKLRSMYALLEKHPEGLHPDMQKEMKEVKLKEGEVAIKSLHKQVNALGKARTELQHANAARLALHSSWRAFLVEQVSKWQAYSQQFQQQESALAERVSAARTALDTARSNLAVSRSLLQKDQQQEEAEITTVSDDEEESRESKEAANSSAKKINDSLQHLGESLQKLSANADEMMIAEQQAHKRQRVEAPSESPGVAAMDDGPPHFH